MSLRPVGWVFILFGIFWGGWAVAATELQRALHLSTGGLGLLLSLALVGAASANAIGGTLCERFGTGRVVIPASAELLVHVGRPLSRTPPDAGGSMAMWGGITIAREESSTAATK